MKSKHQLCTRKCLTLLLSGLLVNFVGFWPARTCAAQQTQTQAAEIETLKKRVVEWGTNKNVSVKLKSGEKVEGRIAEIEDEHFVIQLVNQGQVTAREIPYGEVKSLKGKNGSKAGKAIGYTVLGALAGIGALVLIMFAVYHDD